MKKLIFKTVHGFNPQMDEFEVLLSLELASRFEGEELWGLLSG